MAGIDFVLLAANLDRDDFDEVTSPSMYIAKEAATSGTGFDTVLKMARSLLSLSLAGNTAKSQAKALDLHAQVVT